MKKNICKRIIVIQIIFIMILMQLSIVLTATDWNTQVGSKVRLGVSIKHPDNFSYKVNDRIIYRPYLGTEKDFSKNLFCLDMNGLFPTENSTDQAQTGTLTAEYTSKGEVTTTSNIPLSLRTGGNLDSTKIKKIMAIMNKGYDEKENNINKLCEEISEWYSDGDKEYIPKESLTTTKIFILQQIAIWEITNGLKSAQIKKTTTPTNLSSWNPESDEQNREIQSIVLSYFRNVANNADVNIPSSSVTPAFSSKGNAKTTTRINGYVYIGPFQISNSSKIEQVKVYGVKDNKESEILNSEYSVYNGKEFSSIPYGDIKKTNNNPFYIRIQSTKASTIDKIKIKISSSSKKLTWWKNESNSNAQPLISSAKEEINDSDESNIEKPTYDVALRKYITKIDNEPLEDSREPEVQVQNDDSAFNGNDFKYLHKKEAVEVKPGQKVTYTIQVYNECENTVKIKGIRDYLPEGLRLADTTGKWTEATNSEDGSRYIVYANEITLTPVTVDSAGKHITSDKVEVTCEVTGEVASDTILTNVAEIVEVTDENGTIQTKGNSEEDSTGNNLSPETRKCLPSYIGKSGNNNLNQKDFYYYGEEDDDDFERLKVKVDGTYTINLLKIDKTGTTITSSEAEFKINELETKTTSNGEMIIAENKKIENIETDDTYVIEETKAPEGYNKYGKKIKLTVKKQQLNGKYGIEEIIVTDENGVEIPTQDIEYIKDENVVTIKVKNSLVQGKYSLNLEKTDENGNIIKTNESTFKIGDTTKTTEDGRLSIAENVDIKNVKNDDEYTVEETKAPEGYNKYEGKISVTVNKIQKDEKYQVNSVTIKELNGSGTEVDKVTIKNGENDKSTNNIIVSLKDGIISIKFKNTKISDEKIDLALRKFIRTINGKEVEATRDPNGKGNSIDTSGLGDTKDTAIYNHPKNALNVNVGDVIVYTIKVYNEGNTSAYAREVTDYIPEGLGYLPTYKLNIDNKWIVEEGSNVSSIKYTELPKSMISKIGNKLVPSDFYDTSISKDETSLDNINIVLGKLKVKSSGLINKEILAFNKSAELESDKLKYQTLQVACIVLNPETYKNAKVETSLIDGNKLKNIAAITKYGDKNNKEIDKDRDSEANEIDVEKYPEDKNIQDDDDYEPVIFNEKSFDLALKKFITTIKTPRPNGTYKEVDYSNRLKRENGDTLSSTNDGDYELDKNTVKVKTGDTVIYTIRIYNEGENDGTAIKVADSLPEGLKFKEYSVDNDGNFVSGSKLNYEYKWKLLVNSAGNWKTGIYSEYLKDKTIKAYNKTTNELSHKDIKLELEVIATKPEEIKNIAEILEDSNGKDRDSTPGNLNEKEDDQDYDVIIPQEFDLGLQKFITGVDEKIVTDRKPILTMENDKIKYTHKTTPYVVRNGNKVTYTIRLYNEGQLAGFPSVVKDDLPDGIRFLKDSEINKKYDWKMYRKVSEKEDKKDLKIITFNEKKYVEVEDVKDADIIATDYYSYSKAKARNENAIQPYDSSKGLTDTNPDYRDLQVQFEVTEDGITGASKIIINTAEIADDQDEDGNKIKDKDSTPNNDVEDEDDIDKEYIQLKYFDLSLLKYVSSVEVIEDGKKKVTETKYDGTENPEPIVKVEINKKKLKTTKVKYTYSIKITNEGEIEGYASLIKDYIPNGLEFVESDNKEYNWKKNKDGSISTDYLKDTLLNPGESAVIKIVLRWKNSTKNLGQKINTAEIAENKDKDGNDIKDIDSIPNNKLEGEDDIDEAIVILSIKTGGTQIYIILILTTISILSVGGMLIYKYVYKPQNENILIKKNKYRRRRK